VEEIVLAGGVANRGAVVRIGDTVRRPRAPHSDAVARLLLHLERAGFDGAPRYLGVDDRGRDVLSWIEGDVPLPVFPGWAMSDQALAGLGRLLREFHAAVAGFDPAEGVWGTELADPAGGQLLCHNDVCPENVVFRDGRPVALLDFDFAAPGRRLWEVVATASMWAPLASPDRRLTHPAGLDAARRTAVLADAYGLDGAERRQFTDVLILRNRIGRAFVMGRVDAGEAPFVDMVTEHGAWERWADNDRWLEAERRCLSEMLLARGDSAGQAT
jgi:hypothetical protein